MFDLESLVRKNIRVMKPYSSARDEFKGNGSIFLDANENSFGSPIENTFNRYPDPLQLNLKKQLAEIKKVSIENIFIGNGSDEPIDLLIRIFCAPGKDNIIINPPTYGMYEVVAAVNDVEVKKSSLTDNFQLDANKILSLINTQTKIIFVCTPNNPTGNTMKNSDIELLLKNFNGIVAVDEAYIDFSKQTSLMTKLNDYPNLVVLQTFSKAWGLAGLRVGMAFTSASIVNLLNKVKFPYNINEYSQQMALKALSNSSQVNRWINEIIAQREWLINELKNIPIIINIFPTDANFILFKTTDAKRLYRYFTENGIVIRDRSSSEKCENCLRVTVGTPEENKSFINALKNFKL